MWAYLKRLFFIYLRPYRRRVLALLGCIVVAVAFDTIFPLGTKFIIDLAIVPGDMAMFLRLVAGLALLYVITTFSNPMLDYLMIWLTTQFLNDLRHRMFAHLQILSAGTHQRLQAGEVLTRFGNDLSTIEKGMYYAVAPGIQQILTLVVGAVVLFQLDWRLALLTGVLLPLPVILPRRTIAAATKSTYRRKAIESDMTGMVQETLAAQATTRAFGLGDRALAAFDSRLAGYAPEALKADFLAWLGYRITGAGQYFIQFLVIAIGGYLALRGQMSVGTLVGFTALLYNLGVSLTDFSSTMALLIPAVASSDRIEGLLGEPVTLAEQPGAPALPAFRHTITFDHVTFGYSGPEHPQLRDVSFSLRSGQSVALVGRSGSGKSTLLHLLQRNYDPQSGRVLLDDCDIRTVAQASLRGQMGLVSQDNFLFNTSIGENIRIGRPKATDAEIITAARAAGIHHVITSLPEGYDTLVGERGGKLSGGQRQRIALARALVRCPAILLLDEATSALDPESEAAIYDTLRELRGNCTILCVTHRLAPVAYMDHIVVMDSGRVAEQGSHAALMAQGGIYHQLYAQQSDFRVSGDGQEGAVTPARLRAIPLFAEVDEKGLARLAERFVAEPLAAGQIVFRQGEKGHKFYILARGKVAVTVQDPDSTSRRIRVEEDGDYFGEIALLASVSRTATVETLLPSLFLTLERQHFASMLAEFPDLRNAVERAAATRLTNPAAVAEI